MNPITQASFEKKTEKGKEVTKNLITGYIKAAENNEALLLKIIDENKDTFYGKKYGFKDIHSAKEYMEKVPMTVYEDYEEYIEKIINGEENPVSVREVVHFAKSSASTGAAKKVPMCFEAVEMFADYTLSMCFSTMDRLLGKSWIKSRGLSLGMIQFEDLNGITYGPASGKVRERFKDVEHYVYTSPIIATYPKGEVDTVYLHLRYALMERDLSFITCSFLNLVVGLMKYLEQNHEMLVRDIKYGIIDENIRLPKEEREILEAALVPMPERAEEIRAEVEKGFDSIMTRVWPNFKFVYGVGSGSFEVYADKLRSYLGDALIHFSVYSASEGIFAVNLEPEAHKMALVLDSAFYEFIDIKDESETSLTLEKIVEGNEYEVVITNLSGFYRYRIGDVVKVSGWLEGNPLIRFLYRKNQMLNMAGEKTNDRTMHHAVSSLCRDFGIELVEYSLYGDYDYTPGRYIVFMECENLKSETDIHVLEKALNEELMKANPSYADKIKRGLLAPLKLYFLRENSFEVYRRLMVANGGSVAQLKPVRLIDNPLRKEFFFSMVKM